jgi:hypothetical protein
LGLGIAGALALAAAVPAGAAPVLSNSAAVKAAAADHVTDVRWRGGNGAGIAAGVIGGLALGAAIASTQPYYGPGYYEPYPAYGYYGGGGYYGGPRVYSYDAYPAYPGYYSGDSRGYYRGRVDTNAVGNW